jgi:hypothetical protein
MQRREQMHSVEYGYFLNLFISYIYNPSTVSEKQYRPIF